MTAGRKSISAPYLLLALSAVQELLICLLCSELPGLHPYFFPAEPCPYFYIQVPSLHTLLQWSVYALLAGSPDYTLHDLPIVQTGPGSSPSLATPLLFGHHLCKHGKVF